MAEIKATALETIAQISAQEWDALAGNDNPFISHAFLLALEQSGCTTAQTGWQPYHLKLTSDASLAPQALMPLYIKGHSYGEYVFDQAWADAYERAGGRYYPKLQSSVPFTPVTSPRLLYMPDAELTDTQILSAAADMAEKLGLSSCHITFMEAENASAAEQAGYLVRTDQQFHWFNRDYDDFDSFLASLSSRKRK